MIAGALAGGYFGAHYAQKLPQPWIRRFVIAVGIGMTVYFFAKAYERLKLACGVPCSAAVPAAVVRASRPHRRGQDALGTTGRMPALHKWTPLGELHVQRINLLSADVTIEDWGSIWSDAAPQAKRPKVAIDSLQVNDGLKLSLANLEAAENRLVGKQGYRNKDISHPATRKGNRSPRGSLSSPTSAGSENRRS